MAAAARHSRRVHRFAQPCASRALLLATLTHAPNFRQPSRFPREGLTATQTRGCGRSSPAKCSVQMGWRCAELQTAAVADQPFVSCSHQSITQSIERGTERRRQPRHVSLIEALVVHKHKSSKAKILRSSASWMDWPGISRGPSHQWICGGSLSTVLHSTVLFSDQLTTGRF